MHRAFLLVFPLMVTPACGSAPPAPAAAPAPAPSAAGESAPSVAPPPSAPKGIPMSCASGASPCLPDPAFVRRLCDGAFPDVALVLFAKDSPFSRMYMKGDVDGWNADGGASARARLRFDEEVLALRRRAPPAGGVVVGGGTGWLVMRWDGNCYTLDDNELTTRRPPSPKSAPIPFRILEPRTKDALLEDPKVLAAYQKRGHECKGAMSGDVTQACEQADAALSAAVVASIRGGQHVPVPGRIP